MFNRKTSSATPSRLEKSIEDLHNQLDSTLADTEQADRLTDQLTKLYKLREYDSKQRVSTDTLVLAGANLLGIAMIVGAERAGLVTSKALGFVQKTLR